MKPVKLTMSAFGPFSGQVEIDFTRFERDGLFLLNGETGAGKTSIFDAISYALFGEVSGGTRGKDNLRSDFAKPETDTFVRLEFEHRGINYTVSRSPEYERPKLRGEGTTIADATVEFIMPERVLVRTRDVNSAIAELLSVTYEQFKQIMMIAQGEFLVLITASSDERTAIMRRVFDTAKFEDMQKRLTAQALELKRRYDTLKAEQTRLENSFIANVDTSDEHIDSLAKMRNNIRSELDALTIKIEQAKQLNAALDALEIDKAKLGKNEQSVKETERELAALKDDEPLRKHMETVIAEIEAALPKYAEFTEKSTALRKKTSELFDSEKEYAEISEQIDAEKTELIEVKSTLESFVSAETDAVMIENELNAAAERADRLKMLEEAQTEWKIKNAVYIKLQEKYFAKKKLFDDGLAGRLAENLKDGEPCPVCGSAEHPRRAELPEKAPTQAEYEICEKAYEKARADVIAANEKRELLSSELLSSELEAPPENSGNTGNSGNIDKIDKIENISDIIRAHLQTVAELTRRKKQADDSVELLNAARSREKQISADIDKITEREKILRENISVIKTEVEIIKLEIIVLKKDLKHDKETAAKSELEKTKSELRKSENELRDKIEKYQLLRESAASLTALIENDEKAIREISEKLDFDEAPAGQKIDNISKIDMSEFETRKALLTEQAAGLERQERIALSAKETNVRIQNELAECREKLETADKLYGDAELIAKTANGTLSGKNKLRFETYVQQVYFDRVLEEASVRFNIMTDGRFELIRQSADKIKGRAGLDIDVFDNWTQTSRPAKTLSGGQCFMAALSLALGLSDVMQAHSGGIQIDTIFIDEGFGSLDSESLECAMNVIAGLADGNRIVGIISHVDALKDRIPNKILIERGKMGSRIVQ